MTTTTRDIPHEAPIRCLVWFWGTGGAGIRFTYRLTSEIAAQLGAGNVSVSLHVDNAWASRLEDEGVGVHCVTGPAGLKDAFPLILALPRRVLDFQRHLRALRPDVVVVPMNFAACWPSALLCRMVGAALVYTVHDATPHPGDYAPRIQRFTQNRLISLASQLVGLSSFVGENLRDDVREVHGDKLRVVPLVRHGQAMRDKPRTLRGGPVRILFLGRLIRYKGFDVLAAACELLKNRDDWQLSIFGNGPEAESLIQMLSGYRQVDLNGVKWLLEEEVDEAVATHDILICPYEEASQSGALAEAQYEGMPCIVTPVGALVEQIDFGRAGWVAEEATGHDLAAAIAQALDNREAYAAKSQAALDMAGQRIGSTPWGEIVRDAARDARSRWRRKNDQATNEQSTPMQDDKGGQTPGSETTRTT